MVPHDLIDLDPGDLDEDSAHDFLDVDHLVTPGKPLVLVVIVDEERTAEELLSSEVDCEHEDGGRKDVFLGGNFGNVWGLDGNVHLLGASFNFTDLKWRNDELLQNLVVRGVVGTPNVDYEELELFLPHLPRFLPADETGFGP